MDSTFDVKTEEISLSNSTFKLHALGRVRYLDSPVLVLVPQMGLVHDHLHCPGFKHLVIPPRQVQALAVQVRTDDVVDGVANVVLAVDGLDGMRMHDAPLVRHVVFGGGLVQKPMRLARLGMGEGHVEDLRADVEPTVDEQHPRVKLVEVVGESPPPVFLRILRQEETAQLLLEEPLT